MWPSAWDQPFISNEFSDRGVAFELFQVRNGEYRDPARVGYVALTMCVIEHNIGKPTARGPFVEGTPKAIREEMDDVLTRLKGSEGGSMREKMKALGSEVERDLEVGGGSYEEMLRILRLGD